MPSQDEPLTARLSAAREGFERLLNARHDPRPSTPEAGFRHWGDTPQWYDWHKR
jgi:hypothetical protein